MSSPISFKSPGAIGDADVVVDDGVEYQGILGFGAALSKPLFSSFPFDENRSLCDT